MDRTRSETAKSRDVARRTARRLLDKLLSRPSQAEDCLDCPCGDCLEATFESLQDFVNRMAGPLPSDWLEREERLIQEEQWVAMDAATAPDVIFTPEGVKTPWLEGFDLAGQP